MTPRQKLLNLAASLGLTCHEVDTIEQYMYDGNGNVYYTKFGARFVEAAEVALVSNLAHEIAHWLCAAPERRSLPEYGLGSGPETLEPIRALDELKGKPAAAEEAQASLLGMILEQWAGQDPKKFTFDEHGWYEGGLKKDIPAFMMKYADLVGADENGFHGLTYAGPGAVNELR